MEAWAAVATSPWTVVTTTTKSSAARSRIFRRTLSRNSKLPPRDSRPKWAVPETASSTLLRNPERISITARFSITSATAICRLSRPRLRGGLPKAPFDREQFGGSIAGPLKANKAWWFASAEYRNQNATIETGERDFTTGSILNTYAPAPLRDALFSTRADYQLDSTNTLMARYSFNRSTDTNQASAASVTPSSSATERQKSLNRFNSLVTSWTKTLSATKVNNVTFHFDTFLNSIPEFPNSAPTTNPTGLASTNELIFPDLADGVNFNVPQSTHLN